MAENNKLLVKGSDYARKMAGTGGKQTALNREKAELRKMGEEAKSKRD